MSDLPAIVVVDPDDDSRARLEAELVRRYGDDYRVRAGADPAGAVTLFEDLGDRQVPVALVLAAVGDRGGGAALLAQAAARHPASKRGLLVDFGAWGDPVVASEIRAAVATGDADYYVLKPNGRGDELFHRTVSEFLHEFWRSNVTAEPREFVVIAPRWAARGHDLRRLLAGNGIPHVFYEADSVEAKELLTHHGVASTDAPVVVTLRGEVLVDPTDAQLARNYGVATAPGDHRDYDLVVVGAGPGGLAAAISAAAEGLSVLVVEREHIGGQSSSSARIRNYPGFARGVAGAELAQRSYQQAWTFGVEFLHMCEVTELRPGGDRHVLVLGNGREVTGTAVLLAMGVSYRRLGVPAVEELLGRGVYYGASVAEARSLAGGRVFVVGGANSAGQAALHLARTAAHVTILCRERSLAAGMSRYLRDEIATVDNITVELGATVVDGGGDAHLEWIAFRDGAGATRREPADALFLFIGGVPRTEWLPAGIVRDDNGYVLTGMDLASVPGAPAGRGDGGPPGMFETSVPGVYAVGDVRAGSVKRIAAAVGSGSVVVVSVLDRVSRTLARHGGAS
jgi:thioredoxin reductase (NADPH)